MRGETACRVSDYAVSRELCLGEWRSFELRFNLQNCWRTRPLCDDRPIQWGSAVETVWTCECGVLLLSARSEVELSSTDRATFKGRLFAKVCEVTGWRMWPAKRAEPLDGAAKNTKKENCSSPRVHFLRDAGQDEDETCGALFVGAFSSHKGAHSNIN